MTQRINQIKMLHHQNPDYLQSRLDTRPELVLLQLRPVGPIRSLEDHVLSVLSVHDKCKSSQSELIYFNASLICNIGVLLHVCD